MADSGWVAVAGAVVGGALTGAIALLQTRSQHRFDSFKLQEERKVTDKEQEHTETARRREELLQIYTRYQLAADRLENAIRELAEARQPATLDEYDGRAGAEIRHLQNEPIRELYDSKMQAHEAAQNEYDAVCELLKLLAPSNTVKAALQQRQQFNRFIVAALDGRYDHKASHPAIIKAADPVLSAMRSDLGSLD